MVFTGNIKVRVRIIIQIFIIIQSVILLLKIQHRITIWFIDGIIWRGGGGGDGGGGGGWGGGGVCHDLIKVLHSAYSIYDITVGV